MSLSTQGCKKPQATFRVLVIEDDDRVARLVMVNLTRAGLQAHHATDGDSGCNAFEELKPHLLLLDLGLPGVDGFDVCARIRRRSTVPIIILTARDGGKDQIRSFKLGADDYVTKPFHPQILLERIRAHLRRTYPTADTSAALAQTPLTMEQPAQAPQQQIAHLQRMEMLSAMPPGWASCQSCSFVAPFVQFQSRVENYAAGLLCPQCESAQTPALAAC